MKEVEVIKTTDRNNKKIVIVHNKNGSGDLIDYIVKDKVSFQVVKRIAELAQSGFKISYKEVK